MLLVRALLLVAAGKVKRLVISMPPQHGKSELVSKWFVAWMLGNFPWLRVILASYNKEFAAEWGEKVRDTLEEWGKEIFGVEVDQRSSAKHKWRLKRPPGYKGNIGRMDSVGIGGAANGKAADLLIIDDPIKNGEEALSATVRAKHKRWVQQVAEARLSADGALILVMTRWHEDDLAGWLYEQALQGIGEDLLVVVLPALALDPEHLPPGAKEYFGPDPLGRAPGEPLCPELHNRAKLEAVRSRDQHDFWGVFQQFPHNVAGNVFQRDKFQRFSYEACPLVKDPDTGVWRQRKNARFAFDRVIQSWDFTYGSKNGRSFCVGQVWGQVGDDYWLLHQVRAKLTFDQMLENVKRVSSLFPMAGTKLIEAKAAGPDVIRQLRKEIPGIVDVPVRADKVVRGMAVCPLVNTFQTVFIPEDFVEWVPLFLQEVCAFPMFLTDDQVDAMSQALAYLQQFSHRYRTFENKPKGL